VDLLRCAGSRLAVLRERLKASCLPVRAMVRYNKDGNEEEIPF